MCLDDVILESLSLASAPGLRYLWNNLGLLFGCGLVLIVMTGCFDKKGEERE